MGFPACVAARARPCGTGRRMPALARSHATPGCSLAAHRFAVLRATSRRPGGSPRARPQPSGYLHARRSSRPPSANATGIAADNFNWFAGNPPELQRLLQGHDLQAADAVVDAWAAHQLKDETEQSGESKQPRESETALRTDAFLTDFLSARQPHSVR